jgi:hypothetical protein
MGKPTVRPQKRVSKNLKANLDVDNDAFFQPQNFNPKHLAFFQLQKMTNLIIFRRFKV